MMNPFKYGCTVAGEYFCQRPELSRQLRNYVESGQNVVIQGERRMGKTSLVLETVRHMRGMALLHIDLLCVRDTADFCRRMAVALARLENSAGFVEKAMLSLARLRPTLTIDPDSGSPVLSVDTAAASELTSVEEVMDAVIAQTAKRKVCVVFDEFQDILDFDDGRQILAILRSRIQLDSHTAYVFMGSIRNRMTDIFWSPDSPFYHSAAALPVGGIDYGDFIKFLRSRFATGRRTLPEAAFATISKLANDTPGYVQELCEVLWDVTEPCDEIDDKAIALALSAIFAREQDHYEIFVRRLTSLQVRVLRGLAIRGGKEVYSADFLSVADSRNAASVRVAFKKLESDGLVYNYEGEYKFVNPFFGAWIRHDRLSCNTMQ